MRHCCIKATGVLAMIQSSKTGASGPVENHDEPGIRGQLSGFWVRRCDQPGWADRLMQQCRLICSRLGQAGRRGLQIRSRRRRDTRVAW